MVRRRWWLWLALAAATVLAAAAFLSLQPAVRGGPGLQACSPQPCAAPGGFEVDISQLQSAGDRVSAQVRFRNHTQGDLLDAVSYRHTSPADFALRAGDGRTLAPVFTADCPKWEEVRVERGSTVGPEQLCFQDHLNDLRGASMVWSPDLGLLFRQVSIPLG
jgi:hypothetical protein